MKKYIILSIIVIIAVGSISYMFASYRINNLQIEENNKMYTDIYNKEITGTELATIINKTIDITISKIFFLLIFFLHIVKYFISKENKNQ